MVSERQGGEPMRVLTIHQTHTTTRGSDKATTVHPGWLSGVTQVVDDGVDHGQNESARFSAFAQLMRTAGALDRAATDILGSLGITAGAFFALLELEMVGDAGIAPSELARRLAVARRTATLYVDILVKQGWVSRAAHPDDKRMILARLTPAGLDLMNGDALRYKAQLARLLETLDADHAQHMYQLLGEVPLEPATLDCEFLSTCPDGQN
jgi:DNA-binding MarR family transcriptional regulator